MPGAGYWPLSPYSVVLRMASLTAWVYTKPVSGKLDMCKCPSCNGTLRNDETVCFICGAQMPQPKTKLTLQDRFRIGVKIAFFCSGGLTIASLFTSFTPSFVKCLVNKDAMVNPPE